MKTRRASEVLGIVCCFFVLMFAERAHAQGVTITIIGPPNGTRITDCETGQLVGSGFLGAVYWGVSTDPNTFTQLGATMNIINGQLAGGNRTVFLPGPVGSVNLFGAAWESAHGATYEQASQVSGAKVGRSAIIAVVPPDNVRIPDFQVCPVPEPSSWALVGLGLLAVAIRHRLSRRS